VDLINFDPDPDKAETAASHRPNSNAALSRAAFNCLSMSIYPPRVGIVANGTVWASFRAPLPGNASRPRFPKSVQLVSCGRRFGCVLGDLSRDPPCLKGAAQQLQLLAVPYRLCAIGTRLDLVSLSYCFSLPARIRLATILPGSGCVTSRRATRHPTVWLT
jgi:hypothetical protein